jgi:hypothetical protein
MNQSLPRMTDVCVTSTADVLCGSRAFQDECHLFVAQRYALCTTFKVIILEIIFMENTVFIIM